MTSELTSSMIRAGKRLLENLDRAGFEVRACFWLYDTESARWRLAISSPVVRVEGSRAAYAKIRSVAEGNKLTRESFTVGTVRAIKDTDQLVRALGKGAQTGAVTSGARLTETVVDGAFVTDAYVYRAA